MYHQGHLNQHTKIWQLLYNLDQTSVLHSLAEHLEYTGRNEEALIATRDEVAVYRAIAEGAYPESREGLARSLCSLSYFLKKLGYLDEAFKAADEAVTIQ